MTRYQIAVRDYIKGAGGSATVADILAFCCSIPQLERLEHDGYVKVDGSLMGNRVTWQSERARALHQMEATVADAIKAQPEWKPKCEFCCDTGFIDWRMEKPAVPCTECSTYKDTRSFPIIGRRR